MVDLTTEEELCSSAALQAGLPKGQKGRSARPCRHRSMSQLPASLFPLRDPPAT